mgnify:FL=1
MTKQKQKRHRRTKAEMILARAASKKVEKPEKKRHRRTKAEMAQVRAEKEKIKAEKESLKEEKKKRKRKTSRKSYDSGVAQVKGLENGPIFSPEPRKPLSSVDLREYLREKYTPNKGIRVVDRILQLVDEHEHMEIQLMAARKEIAEIQRVKNG